MRILHYSLGFPPFRTGGMTKYCTDLMRRQLHSGDAVGLLWPGSITGGSVRIRKGKSCDGIENLQIINPLPVPYDEGIADISLFVKDEGYDCYRNFFAAWKPDVIHLHTLMGLHKSMLQAAKDMGIKTVFTVHDFFPLCPKVSMSHGGTACDRVQDCTECAQCNSTALSFTKMAVLQSAFYRNVKNSPVVTAIRKKHRDRYLEGKAENILHSVNSTAADYIKLRSHYISMLQMTDVLLYNSTLTENIYAGYISHPHSAVLPVTHSDITDKRKIKQSGEKIVITYMGPPGRGKGFSLLSQATEMLKADGRDFALNVFFTPEKQKDYMTVCDRYTYSELDDIMAYTDIVVVPSAAYDTFGFNVPEALSRGVPVIVSENVGAKDIIPAGGGIVIKAGSADALYGALSALDSGKLSDMNRAVVNAEFTLDYESHCRKIKNFYG